MVACTALGFLRAGYKSPAPQKIEFLWNSPKACACKWCKMWISICADICTISLLPGTRRQHCCRKALLNQSVQKCDRTTFPHPSFYGSRATQKPGFWPRRSFSKLDGLLFPINGLACGLLKYFGHRSIFVQGNNPCLVRQS